MIVVRLMGGLGNQLFQYASGRSLAIHHKTDLRLDISSYRSSEPHITPREYGLSAFNINALVAGQDDIQALLPGTFDKSIPGKILRKLRLYKPTFFYEHDFTKFDKRFFDTNPNVYIHGYWAHDAYFKHIAPTLIDELTLREPLSQDSSAVAEQITRMNAVSLHIRRGDYAQASKNSLFYVLPIEYYKRAISYLSALLGELVIFVFSDDPDWVQDNLEIPHTVYYVSNNARKDYEDLWLMSLCKHHIIANSTFSWWGAWLASYTAKVVIGPKVWYEPGSGLDLTLPSQWIRM